MNKPNDGHILVHEGHPPIKLELPDGTRLIAEAFPDGDYPAVNIYLQSADGEKELIAFAESNHDRNGAVCVGAYRSNQDDTTYYEPYMAERESNEAYKNR